MHMHIVIFASNTRTQPTWKTKDAGFNQHQPTTRWVQWIKQHVFLPTNNAEFSFQHWVMHPTTSDPSNNVQWSNSSLGPVWEVLDSRRPPTMCSSWNLECHQQLGISMDFQRHMIQLLQHRKDVDLTHDLCDLAENVLAISGWYPVEHALRCSSGSAKYSSLCRGIWVLARWVGDVGAGAKTAGDIGYPQPPRFKAKVQGIGYTASTCIYARRDDVKWPPLMVGWRGWFFIGFTTWMGVITDFGVPPDRGLSVWGSWDGSEPSKMKIFFSGLLCASNNDHVIVK